MIVYPWSKSLAIEETNEKQRSWKSNFYDKKHIFLKAFAEKTSL